MLFDSVRSFFASASCPMGLKKFLELPLQALLFQ